MRRIGGSNIHSTDTLQDIQRLFVPGICILAVLCYCLNKPVPPVISISTLIDAGVSIGKSPVEEFLHVLPMWLDLPSYDVMIFPSLPGGAAG